MNLLTTDAYLLTDFNSHPESTLQGFGEPPSPRLVHSFRILLKILAVGLIDCKHEELIGFVNIYIRTSMKSHFFNYGMDPLIPIFINWAQFETDAELHNKLIKRSNSLPLYWNVY